MMIFRIGSTPQKRDQSGFSLLEVVLCVIFLSVGIVAVNQTLLRTLSALSYIETRFEADRLAQNKIWEVQNSVYHRNQPPSSRESGVLLGVKKTFSYELRSVPAANTALVYQVRLKIQWPESGKSRGLSRDFYASRPYVPKP